MTTGERIKNLIDNSTMQLKEVANIIKVNPSTMSRYVNDKQIPSGKTIKLVSRLFNVSEEYLRCETDNPALTDTSNIISNEKADESVQNYQFGRIRKWLVSLGADIVIYVEFEGHRYKSAKNEANGTLYPVFGKGVEASDGIKIYWDDMLNKISMNPEKGNVIVEISYGNKKSEEMDYRTYLKWLKDINNMGIYKLMEKVDIEQNISCKYAEDSVLKALEGKRKVVDSDSCGSEMYDKTLDLFEYMSKFGKLRFVIDKDKNVNFSSFAIYNKNDLRKIVELLKKDNKGFFIDEEGKIKYDPSKHILNSEISTDRQKQAVINIVNNKEILY